MSPLTPTPRALLLSLHIESAAATLTIPIVALMKRVPDSGASLEKWRLIRRLSKECIEIDVIPPQACQ